MLIYLTTLEFSEALVLIHQLDCSILASKLACSYIAISVGSFTQRLSAYSDKLRSMKSQVIKGVTVNSQGAVIEIATFKISFEQLGRDHKESTRILGLCAFLHNEDIPNELIRRGLSLDGK